MVVRVSAANEPVGPQAAAREAIEVEAVLDDGSAAPPGAEASGQSAGANGESASGPAFTDDVREWQEALFLVVAGGTALAARRWESFASSKEECARVAAVWAPVCAKRWPLKMTPEVLAAITTLVIFAPKILGAIDEEQARSAARKARADAARKAANEGSPISST